MAVELANVPPDLHVDNQVAGIARSMGLFVRPLGGTILIGPPLIFTHAQADRTVDILDAALERVEAGALAGAAR
jgi:adenosylmethionine-8-amino-7-oxononanoate aminotransferase